MKIWEVIKEGKDGEIYEAFVDVESWNGVKILVTERTGYKAIKYYTLPSNNNKNNKIGNCIPLVGAVCEAEWVRLNEEIGN